jgi:hypothetical protein
MELAIEHLAKEAPEKLSYELPDGKRISYPATRLGRYLNTIYIDIFRGNRKISWVLEALSGRDVRRSLEMFTRILMSGHLDERLVTGTMLGTVEFVIPESLIVRILMKTDYMFYLEGHGFVSNIIYPDPQWNRPSNLLVVEVLESLVSKRKQRGDLGIQVFFKVEGIVRELARMGFYDEDVMAALRYMLLNRLITADHMGRSNLAEEDHVRAHASGLAHLRFLASRLEYLVGILPATYLVDRRFAESNRQKVKGESWVHGHILGEEKGILHELINYLKDEFNRHAAESPFYEGLATGGRLLIRYAEEALSPSSGRPSAERQSSEGLL